MAQPVVSAERTEKRLLVRVLGYLRPEEASQLGQDCTSVFFVELLERRWMHRSHHLL